MIPLEGMHDPCDECAHPRAFHYTRTVFPVETFTEKACTYNEGDCGCAVFVPYPVEGVPV